MEKGWERRGFIKLVRYLNTDPATPASPLLCFCVFVFCFVFFVFFVFLFFLFFCFFCFLCFVFLFLWGCVFLLFYLFPFLFWVGSRPFKKKSHSFGKSINDTFTGSVSQRQTGIHKDARTESCQRASRLMSNSIIVSTRCRRVGHIRLMSMATLFHILCCMCRHQCGYFWRSDPFH